MSSFNNLAMLSGNRHASAPESSITMQRVDAPLDDDLIVAKAKGRCAIEPCG